MLSALYIENIAVIEKASIDFDKGFTVLTGETGAGKSIIIDSIHAVTGARTSKELIRTGTPGAVVTALFTDLNKSVCEVLDGYGISYADDELLIRRDIKPSKSTTKVNGVPVTISMLKNIGNALININGQHDSYELLTPEIHRTYVDAYGGLDNLLGQYRCEYKRLREIKAELDRLDMDENQKLRRIDLLKYQIEEIEAANITVGEREELTSRRDSIKNGESIITNLNSAKELLNGSEDFDGVIASIETAAEAIDNVAASCPQLADNVQKLRDAEYMLEDAFSEIRSFADSFDYDPNELDDIEDRLDFLYRLSLKYGETEDDILKFLDKCSSELLEIKLSSERIDVLNEEFETVKKRAVALAKELSAKRKDASYKFAEAVKSELSYLNMPNVEFSVKQERVNLNNNGCDAIEFLVSANAGEAPKPMSKIASGGELSRIMLAIKTVLSSGDDIGTLIFDEIDTGISGEAAHKVGLKLKEASENRQVICITHLAQIAAMADNQMLIKKNTDGTKTYTEVTPLNHEQRVRELARIIGGDEITPLKINMAEEMLDKSK